MSYRLIDPAVEQADIEIAQTLGDQQQPTLDAAQVNSYRAQLNDAIAAYKTQQQAVLNVHRDIQATLDAITQAREQGNEAPLRTLETTLAQQWQDWQNVLTAQDNAKQSVDSIHQQFTEGLGTVAAFSYLDGQTPLVMFPVRLETRYFADDGNHYELRVRIFPDEIHLDDHQSLMSSEEYELTRGYWDTRLEEGPQGEGVIMAWQSLVQAVGQGRGMWLVGQLDPFGRGGRYESGDTQASAPPFPEVDIAPEDWTQPAIACTLPDRWAIVGYRGKKRVLLHWTNPVPPELQVSPQMGRPGAELLNEAEDALTPDAGIEWITDFAVAETLGMAARIRIRKILARSMERLLVFGVCASQTKELSQTALESLLEAHQSNNLDFLSIGTPTNNLTEQKTEYREKATDFRQTHQQLTNNQASGPGDDFAGFTAQAWGINPTVFRYARRSQQRREPLLQALYSSLWESTWGCLLKDHHPLEISDSNLEFSYEQFTQYVRSGGYYPSVRIQAQPYGVLPIVSLDRWQTPVASNIPEAFINGLRSFRNRYKMIPLLQLQESLYPQQALIEILSLLPQPQFEVMAHCEFSDSSKQFDDTDMIPWWEAFLTQLQTEVVDLQGDASYPFFTRVNHFSIDTVDLTVPLVSPQEDKALPLEANYLAALASDPVLTDVENHQLPGGASESDRPLLYLLARHAYLRVANDPEGDLNLLQGRLATLQDLSVATLESIFNDLTGDCSYRLDSWISSLANRRLREMRATQPTGLHIGGFGYLEGLEPPGEGTQEGTVPEDPDSMGYIHMPSLSQSKTAAVLHGAYLTHKGEGSGETLDIKLSSRRVNRAKGLLDGIRQGQSLAALLGYRFERRIIDQGDGEHILTFRSLAPLSVGELGTTNTDLATVNVVDGLAIREIELSSMLQVIAQPALAELDDALDALSDLLVAEGVHQATNGNAMRAGAAFDAIADGMGLLDEPEVTTTPVSGQQIAHRVSVLLPIQPQAPWSGDNNRLRAQADPILNGWAGAVLGAPGQIRFQATTTPETGEATTQSYTLADFDLCPLDVVYLSAVTAEAAPLVQSLGYFLQKQAAAGSQVEIDAQRQISYGDLERSLEEAIGLAHHLFEVLSESRPLTAEHLQEFANGSAAAFDEASLTDLEGRAQTTLNQFAQLQTSYETDPDNVTAWWQAALIFGAIDPNLPDSISGIQASFTQRQTAHGEITPENTPDRGPRAVAQIKALLSKEFQVISQFTLTNPQAITAAFANQSGLCEGDLTVPQRWLQDYSRVRSPLEPLDLLLTLGELFEQSAALQVAQLPYHPDQPWIGETLPKAGIAPRLSLVNHMPVALNLNQAIAGLLVDSWSESIPHDTAMSGVAFHYDEPKAQAPQAILVAVPPDLDNGWDFEGVEAALLETFDLAKIRTVNPSEIMSFYESHGASLGYMPALYTASELAGPMPPEITRISPDSAERGESLILRIDGAGLGTLTDIAFSGTGISAELQEANHSNIRYVNLAITNDAPAGAQTFQLTNSDGVGDSGDVGITFEVTAPPLAPQINSISPTYGERGQTLGAVISGVGLAGATAVFFSGGGVTAQIRSNLSDGDLMVNLTISRNAPFTSHTFFVITPNGTLDSSENRVTFTVRSSSPSPPTYFSSQSIGGEQL